MRAAQLTLPGGIAAGGRWHRTAALRPLAGHDEEFLIGAGAELSPAARGSELLRRCLESVGAIAPVDGDTVRTLPVGDREALFLHLRRLTFGERIRCVLECPDCGAKMDLDLTVGELLQQPYADVAEVHETIVDGRFRVRFRLPNGADLEAAAPIAPESAETAAALILRRATLEITDLIEGRTLQDMPQPVLDALPARMAELDRQAETVLNLVCPECGGAFTTPFDASDYFQQEAAGQARGLYREVHLLAFHYHWSETEILAMDACKRRMYLELLAEEVGA